MYREINLALLVTHSAKIMFLGKKGKQITDKSVASFASAMDWTERRHKSIAK